MRSVMIGFAAMLLLSAGASGQVLHRCVDAEGKVTFSDRGCPISTKPTSIEVRPNVVDSAGARQVIRQQKAEDHRIAQEQQQRAIQQQQRAIEQQQGATQHALQQDRAQAEAMLREARDLRKKASDARDIGDRAALNRRAQGLEDSAGILRGVPPQRFEGVVNPRTGEFYPAIR